MSIGLPIPIQLPFARGASPSTIQNPIPDTTALPGRASFLAGFPADTMQPVVAGGTPPFGQDFNGLLLAITSYCSAMQGGKLVQYSAATVSAQGGYGRGALLQSADGATIWFNNVDGNVTDPDGSGAGWISLFTYGYSVLGTTGGTRTLTRVEARASVVVLTGSLAANSIIEFPNDLTTWLVVNACTPNGFSMTAKTAAGTGVVVPAGGYAAPVGVYGDGVNLNPTASPLAYPIDQAATPSTLMLRTNAGYALAVYFNQNSSLEPGAVADAFFIEANNDGFLRKLPLLNAAAQLFAAFDPTKILGPNGCLLLPGGVLIQWGTVTFGDLSSGAYANTRSVTYPMNFPAGPAWVVLCAPRGDATAGTAFSRAITNVGFQLVMEEYAGRSQGADCGAFWLAVGAG